MMTYRGRGLLVTDDGVIAAMVEVVLHPVPESEWGPSWLGVAESSSADWPRLFEMGEMSLRVHERSSRCRVLRPRDAGARVDATLSGLEPAPFD